MADRPYVAGAVVIGIVAAALRLGTGGAPASAPGSSLASQPGVSNKHAIVEAKEDFDAAKWSTMMQDHPDKLGKLTAQKELQQTIDDFYQPPKTAIPAAEIDCYTPEGMIAIEPDPVHTHLALWFDRDMDAMEEALQDSGWEYQSNWLPWSASTSASPANKFVDEEQRRLFLKGREDAPGVILFRPGKVSMRRASDGVSCADRKKDRSGYRPLMVFLVGNSPTAGIDRPQFEEALLQLHKLAPDQRELRILGPTFTGSGPSLRSLLSSDGASKFGKITIATGSIADPHCEDLLPDGASGKILLNRDACKTLDSRMTLVSFGLDSEWSTEQIEFFLKDRGHFDDNQIAELTEDESSFGNMYEAPETQRLQLYFPRNISHLRSAYQKSNVFGFGASTQGSGSISLNLDFDEANQDDDSIPSFAGRQVPVSQEGVMHQIADVLEQRHIKVVLLSATDVLDEIFVSEILARDAPNVLVVVEQADNLFLRSGSANNFGNMYFVSQWPLITDSQLWSGPRGFHQKRTFPTDLSQGLYAAARYIFDPQNPNLPDYGSPLSHTMRPPLWVLAVGHGDYWPVALLKDTPKRSPFHLPNIESQGSPAGIFAIEAPPLSQRLLLLLMSLLALYHAAKCFGVSELGQLSFRYTTNDADVRTRKLWLQLAMTALLLLAMQLSIAPSNEISLSHYALYGAGGALCVAAAWLIYVLSGLDDQDLRPVVSLVIVTIFAVAVGFAAYFGWIFLWDWLSGPGEGEFFRYRSSYPLRGVSPVFPLLLVVVGFFIVLYNRLDRFTFTPSFRPRLPERVHGLPNIPGDDDLIPVSRLLECKPTWTTRRINLTLLAIISGVAWVCLTPLHLRPRMFDSVHLQNCLSAAMFVLLVAILWDLVMAARIWYGVKSECLEPLESSSLRRGFSSIRGLTWSSLWILRGSIVSRYRIINRLLEQSKRIVLDGEASSSKDGVSLQKAFQDMLEEYGKKPLDLRKVSRAFGPLQERIAFVGHLLLEKLHRSWIREENLTTAPDALTTEDKSSEGHSASQAQAPDVLQRLREEWVALVYVHYVRIVLLQIRTRLLTAAMLYLILVWAATSYPYLNRHSLMIGLSVLLGVLAFGVITIYASINRDPILSRATNHVPGHLDLDFYVKTITLVGVPLIGFVAAQFPEVSSFLFSWIEPGMSPVK